MPKKKSAVAIAVGVVLLFVGVVSPLFARGPRWRRVNVGQATYPMQTIYAFDSLLIWASTGFGDVLYTKDGGLKWNSFSLDSCCAPLLDGIANTFFFFDSLNGWMAGRSENDINQRGFRSRTTNGGKSWLTQIDFGEYQGVQLQFFNRKKGIETIRWDCALKDSFLVTNDSGRTWQIRTTQVPACAISRFHFVDSLSGWGISFRPAPNNTAIDLLRTRDGGNGWAALSVSIPICAGAKIWFQDTLNGWMWHCNPMVSNQARFSRTRDGGITWDSLSGFSGDFWFYTFEMVDTAHFWLAGYNGFNASAQFSSDGGRTWTEQMPGVGDNIVGFDAVDSNHAYAVGGNGYVYIYAVPFIGDLNLDWNLAPSDIVLLLNYVFLNRPTSVPPEDMDFNNDCTVTSADVVLLLNKVFLGSPELQWGCAEP